VDRKGAGLVSFREKRKAVWLCGLLVVIVGIAIAPNPLPVMAEDTADLKARIRAIYIRLVDAERNGARIEEAAAKLNTALQMAMGAHTSLDQSVRSALLLEAERIAAEVEASVPELIREAENEARTRTILMIAVPLALVMGGLLVYVYGPRILWELWLRARSGWWVERHD